MRIWVLGAQGLLGSAVLKILRDRNISFAASTREQVNCTNLNSIAAFCRAFGPFTHILNCAGYTAVDLAESHQEEAFAANALGPALLALFAANANMHLVHLSSDYVFNGNASVPYKESDLTDPATVYGKSKAEGERRLFAIMPNACLIRTSWLFHGEGTNFFTTILEKMKTQEELRVVSDQKGRPTYVPDLAAVLISALRWSGIYHMANAEETTWFHFAEAIFQEASAQGVALRCKKIIPVASSEYPTAAKRPLYSVLDTQKVEKRLGWRFRSWREGVKECLCAGLSVS